MTAALSAVPVFTNRIGRQLICCPSLSSIIAFAGSVGAVVLVPSQKAKPLLCFLVSWAGGGGIRTRDALKDMVGGKSQFQGGSKRDYLYMRT
jgi:hypothetical protein